MIEVGRSNSLLEEGHVVIVHIASHSAFQSQKNMCTCTHVLVGTSSLRMSTIVHSTHAIIYRVTNSFAGEVERMLDSFKPSVVVHAAAERRPDVVKKQPDAAKALNVAATRTFAELCDKKGIFMLYISSDYVFDGKTPPYKPGDKVNPLNTYGETKRDGELEVLKYEGNAVLRIPVLYGEVEQLGESAVTTLFTAVMDTSKSSKHSDYERRYPTHVTDVAQVCVQLAEKHVKSGDACGIWHWSGKECHTKYTMACIMAEVFGLPKDHLSPVREPTGGAPRPYDAHLDRTATESVLQIRETPFREGIHQVLQPYFKT